MQRFAAVAAAAVVAVVLGGVAYGGTSATAVSGSMTVVTEDGVSAGLGDTFSFEAPATTFLMWGDGNQVQVVVRGPNFPANFADAWVADFAAPAGQPLAIGDYSATLSPFQAPNDAGMRVEGVNDCGSTAAGSFSVSNVGWGPFNYLQSIDLSFVEYCDGSTTPDYGELHLVAPPAPLPLKITFTVNSNDSIVRPDGSAIVTGTIACTQPGSFGGTGRLMQLLNNKRTAAGFFDVTPTSQCGSAPTAWQATVYSSTGFGFANAPANIHLAVATLDPFYTSYTGKDVPVQATLDATVMLAPGTRTGQS